MTIKQLSVFLENKTGRINDLTRILSREGINMHAFSMAETPDFGILRLIVSEVERAVEVLRNENFAVMLTDVVCIKCDNQAGALSTILERLSEREIFIEYMYAFANGEDASAVLKCNDADKAADALHAVGFDLYDAEEAYHKNII